MAVYRQDAVNWSQGRSIFSGFLASGHQGPGQYMNNVRDGALMMVALCGWLLLSSLASADVLVDQSVMLGQSVEGNSQILGNERGNFAVHIERGFVKLNLVDRIDLTEGGSLSSRLCFLSDMGKGEYRLTASSWHGLHDDQLVFRSAEDDIPYAMSIGESSGDEFQSNSAGAIDPSCSTGSQASLTVSVDNSLLPDLWLGSYTDTITLLVLPE